MVENRRSASRIMLRKFKEFRAINFKNSVESDTSCSVLGGNASDLAPPTPPSSMLNHNYTVICHKVSRHAETRGGPISHKLEKLEFFPSQTTNLTKRAPEVRIGHHALAPKRLTRGDINSNL